MRLPFGTTPVPEEYTNISEASIELGNDLFTDTSWDVTNLQSLHRNLLPVEDYIPASDTLVKEDKLAVNIEIKDASMDGFFDAIIAINIENPFWVEISKNGDLLFIHTIFMPL